MKDGDFCENCKMQVRAGLRKQTLSNGSALVFKVCLSSNPPHRLLKGGQNISHDAVRRMGTEWHQRMMLEYPSRFSGGKLETRESRIEAGVSK